MVLILGITTGCSNKTVCVYTDAQQRDGLKYLPNKTKPFTGNNLCKYENGQIWSKGKYKDGKRHGNWTFWDENGNITLKVYCSPNSTSIFC